MRRVKIVLSLLLVALTSSLLHGAVDIFYPNGKFDSRFLIVVDRKSYEEATIEVMAYKRVLEEEGLGAVVMVGEWATPERLKRDIIKIYNGRPVLEGAVFIGDIPIVRIRNFQHATTAFKMNEKSFPMEESSVTSDRFYDDLNLEFHFIGVDENNPRHFYYKLKESSPQVIRSSFYSARILPPSNMGVERYELLRRYLRKVITAHQKENYADNIKIFNGHGYNFDCLTVWREQPDQWRELFPEAFTSSRGNGFYNFRQDPYMKGKLLERVERPGTDLFVFHEHGAFDTQYINGDYRAPQVIGLDREMIGPPDAMAIELRRRYRSLKGERREEFKKEAIANYNLLPSFFEEAHIRLTTRGDSLYRANNIIKVEELKGFKPQPPIVIFDACYNGAFHKEDYVAGYYLFSEGKTVVTQGNSVNVLQDKWSTELMGMLAEGARIGFWQREVQTLESHLMGDPTYRLTPGTPASGRTFEGFALNKNLAMNRGANTVWLRYLNSDNPNYQALALKQLAYNPPKEYADILLKQLKESPYISVRMEAFQRILYDCPEKIVEAITVALEDSSEEIRRNGARFAGYSGHCSLIPSLVNVLLFANESQRVQYAAQGALAMFPFEMVKEVVERRALNSYLPEREKVAEEIISYYANQERRYRDAVELILDSDADSERRIMAARNLRNNNYHPEVERLIDHLYTIDSMEVKMVIVEAIGWFNRSYKRQDLIKELHKLHRDRTLGKELRAKIEQTILRLK